jgi:hypothetical protein
LQCGHAGVDSARTRVAPALANTTAAAMVAK